eukprot:g43.t1
MSTTTLVSYDGTWKERADLRLHEPRRGCTAVSFGGNVILIGGETLGPTQRADVWKTSTSPSDDWTLVSNNTAFGPRAFHASAIQGNAIWVFGGGGYGCAYKGVEGITLRLCDSSQSFYSKDGGKTWYPGFKDVSWSPRLGLSSQTHMDKVWIFGGVGVTTHPYPELLNDVWFSEDPISASWTKIPNEWCSNLGTYGCGGGWIGGSLFSVESGALWYVDGGLNFPHDEGNSVPANDAIRMTTGGGSEGNLNVSKLRWKSERQNAPSWSGRIAAGSTLASQRLWVTGGSTSSFHWDYKSLFAGWNASSPPLHLLPSLSGTSATAHASAASEKLEWTTNTTSAWPPRCFHAVVGHAVSELYIFGGADASSYRDDVWVLNTSSMPTPSPTPPPPTGSSSTECRLGDGYAVQGLTCTVSIVIFGALVASVAWVVVVVYKFRKRLWGNSKPGSAPEALTALLEESRRRSGMNGALSSDPMIGDDSTRSSSKVPRLKRRENTSMRRRNFDERLMSEYPSKFIVDRSNVVIGKEIGRGASGCVYLARYADTKIAVKEIFVPSWQDDRFRAHDRTTQERRIRATRRVKAAIREIGILSKLRHPKIVRMYGLSLRRPHLLILMEYCPMTLDDLLRSSRRALARAHLEGSEHLQRRRRRAPTHKRSLSTSAEHIASLLSCSGKNLTASMSTTSSRSSSTSSSSSSSLSSVRGGGKEAPSRLRLTRKRALSILRQIASGMSFLHSSSIVHRDVKPANLLLDASYDVKIADFGLARVSSENAHTLSREAGTPIFMSPETMRGSVTSDWSPRLSPMSASPASASPSRSLTYDRSYPSDIYSFGIIVWMMLTLEMPYDIKTLARLGPLGFMQRICGGMRPSMKRFEIVSAPVLSSATPTAEFAGRLPLTTTTTMICRCWAGVPETRPTFREIEVFLRQQTVETIRKELPSWGEPVPAREEPSISGRPEAAHEQSPLRKVDDIDVEGTTEFSALEEGRSMGSGISL